MCGIAGAIDAMAERAVARVGLLNDAQTHRGPDNAGIAQADGTILSNTRLAIQDPTAAGNQPFVSADGRYTCVFDGEIYDHRQLVEQFRLPVPTACHGGVIAQLWAKLGVEGLAELRGMFAIALADTLEGCLYLACDPFEMKPIYWRLLPDGSFAFVSEVRSLAQLAPGRRVDDAAVARYLCYGAMAADQSSFLEITAIPLNSVAIAGKDHRVEVRPVRPDGPTTVKPRHDGHRFQRVQIVLEESNTARFFQGMQRPTVDGLNTYLISRAVHQADFKVVMSGLGEDEAVAEYSYFRRLKYLPLLRAVDAVSLPVGVAAARLAGALVEAGEAKARRPLGKGSPRSGAGRVRLQRELLPASLVTDLTRVASTRMAGGEDKASCWPAGRSPGSFAAMATAEVAIYSQATLLPDADTFSMASSVELRVPFVDGQVFSAALESARGRYSALGKAATGKAFGDRYLAAPATQPKCDLSLPVRPWLMGPLAPLVTAAYEPDAPVWSLVEQVRAVRAELTSPRPRRRWAATRALTALDAWLETRAGNLA